MQAKAHGKRGFVFPQWALNLVIIDGGRGQLQTPVREIFEGAWGLTQVALLAVAQGGAGPGRPAAKTLFLLFCRIREPLQGLEPSRPRWLYFHPAPCATRPQSLRDRLPTAKFAEKKDYSRRAGFCRENSRHRPRHAKNVALLHHFGTLEREIETGGSIADLGKGFLGVSRPKGGAQEFSSFLFHAPARADWRLPKIPIIKGHG